MRQHAHRNPSRYRNTFALATCCSLLCRSWSMHMRWRRLNLRLHRPPVARLLLMKLMRCSRLSRGPCGGKLLRVLRVLQLLQRVGTPSRCCMLLSWCGWRRCGHLGRARDCFRHSIVSQLLCMERACCRPRMLVAAASSMCYWHPNQPVLGEYSNIPSLCLKKKVIFYVGTGHLVFLSLEA